MKIVVAGLWHLGSVTAACLSKLGFQVLGLDEDSDVITNLNRSQAPLYEPGLNELIKEGLDRKLLDFSSNVENIYPCDYVWICFDTPVNDLDEADTNFVINKTLELLKNAPAGQKIIVSSQLPVESIRCLESKTKHRFVWACSPENLRLGCAIDVFLNPDRIIVGTRTDNKELFAPIFHKISNRIEWMGIESAEMTKHGINAFLAQSVSFANELAQLAVEVGADPYEVARGLKTEQRIGKYAYLRPGPAFSGGTLARDIQYLSEKGESYGLKLKIPKASFESNNSHKNWLRERILKVLGGSLKNKTVGVLGLTYKPGTDTLRRSASIETVQWLLNQGAKVIGFDPRIKTVSNELNLKLCHSAEECLMNADLIYVGTEHPEFKNLSEKETVLLKSKPLIDPSEFLGKLSNNYCFSLKENIQ